MESFHTDFRANRPRPKFCGSCYTKSSSPESSAKNLEFYIVVCFYKRYYYLTKWKHLNEIWLHLVPQATVLCFKCISSKTTSTNLCGWNIMSKILSILSFFSTSMFEISYFCIKWCNFLGTKNHMATHFYYSIPYLKGAAIFDCVDNWTW